MANVFTLTPGIDNFTGLSGDDNIFDFASSNLQSTDTITGGATGSFIDILRVTAAGTIAASQFAGVTNVEELLLSSEGNGVTLTNGVIAGSSIGYFAVVDGAGNDTVDASGVTNNVAVAFFASSGNDTFKGGNGNDAFVFNPADLTSADTVQGDAGVDNLYLNAAGTLAAGAFTNVTGIEGLVLANGTNNVTLTNGLVAGTSIGYFAVAGGTGDDTVDASGISNSIPVAFFSNGGSDTFQGGNGNDAFVFAAADLPSATIAGGAGIDNLYLTNAGTVAAVGFANVTGFEGLVLSNGTNNITLTNGFVAGTSIGYVAVAGGTGDDAVDASGVTNNTPIAFYGTTGGNDTFTGGNGNDSYLFTAGTLTSSDTVVGGAGNDTLWMTTAATVTTAALAGVSGIEGVFQQSGGTFNFANGLTGTGNLAAVGSSAVDTFNGAAVTGYALTFTGNGGADALTGGSLDDTFNIPDSAFASINGNAGLDRIVLTTAAQVFDLTANAAKISNVEVVSLANSAAATLSLAAADIPQINAAGNSLYVIGGGDDQINVADTWVLMATGQTNPNLPGFTFNQYHNNTTNSELFVADTIPISITVVANTPPTIDVDGVLNYIENGAPAAINSTITITDTTDTHLEGATVQITGGFVSGQDVLDFINTASITGIFSGDTLTLTGHATLAEYEAALESVTYQNSSDDPSTAARTITFTVNDGTVDSNADTATVNVAARNDEPTLSATGLNPSFTENSSAVDLYSTVTASTVEAGQDLDQLVLTVTNVSGTTAEFLTVDGSQVELTNGNSETTATNGMTAAVSIASGTATVTISKAGGITSAAMAALVDGLSYGNTSDAPGGASRVVTITSLRDTGPNGGGNDNINSTLSIASTVAVTPVNDEPTLTATGTNPTFTENGAAADLFSSVTASTVEAGQTLDQLALTVTNVSGTTVESLTIDGTQVELTNGNSETTATNGMTAAVSVSSGTATVTISKAAGITPAQMQTLVDNLAYTNTSDTPDATTHVVSITSLSDNGSNTPPNDDTAALNIQSTVTVVPVNDAPVAADFTFNGANAAIGNTALVVNDASDGPPDPTGPQKTITGDLLAGATDVDTTLNSLTITAETITNASGTLIIEADGDFTYLPTAGFTGNAVFNYTLNDNDASGNLTDTGQVTINVAAPRVWYVDDSAAPGGDGTSDNPFNSLAALSTGGSADGLDGANDIIFVYGGTYSTGIVLEDGQQLIGQSQGLTVNGTALEGASGGNPLINGAVVLAGGNTIDGINIGNTGSSSVFALSGSNVGNAVFTDGLINNTSGGAININGSGTGMNLQFTSVSSTGSSTNAISFNEARGTFNAGSGTLSNAGGNTVNITGNNANDDLNFTYGGALNDDGNLLVNITGQTGGTRDFNGLLTDGSGAGGGISLTSNTGATIRFDGGMSLNTTTSAGFTATGGGTVAVTDPAGVTANTIVTTTGTALNVANTTIHADDLTFQSISANGAVNGIVLNNTGTLASNGGLIVTGDTGTSANGSGGTIQNSTGAGILLTNTRDVSLDQMNVTSGDADGIHGVGVVNFTLNRSNITNNGDSTADDGLQFGEASGSVVGVTGNVSILASSISGNAHNGVHMRNTSGTIDNLTVTNSTFNDVNDTFGANAFLFEASGTSTITEAFITGSTFSNNTPQRALEVQSHDTATISDFVVSGNIFTNNGIHASFTQDGSSNNEFYFVNNGTVGTPMTGSILQAINVFSSSQSTGGTIVGTIQGNQVGSTQAGAISAVIQGQTDATLLIDSNVISQTNGDSRAIGVAFRGPSNPLAGTLGPNTVVSDVTITNNNVTPGAAPSGFPLATIVVEADNQTGADNKAPTVHADIRGNTVPTTPVFDLLDAHIIYYEYDAAGGHGIGQLVNTTGAATADEQLDNTNAGTVGSNGISLIAGPINVPPSVPTPLLAAFGGVEAGIMDGDPPPVLTQAELDGIVNAAIARWSATGLPAEQVAALETMTFSVADLSGLNLGSFTPEQITLDADAAGRGWFIDETPQDDREFGNVLDATHLQTDPTGAPAGDMDLLTVLMHEMGHALGLDHDQADLHDVMSDTLVVGERRLPDAADVAQAQQETAVVTAQAAEAALPAAAQAPAGSPIVGAGFTQAAAATTHDANHGAALCDAFDFSALLASPPNGDLLEARLEQAFAEVKDAFAALRDAHADDQPLADLAAQLHDGPLGDLLHLVDADGDTTAAQQLNVAVDPLVSQLGQAIAGFAPTTGDSGATSPAYVPPPVDNPIAPAHGHAQLN